ncbi:hypothetical protein M0R19_03605 [Candidatus Pacearchaeota archaeon]|jgi:hypothetical protein|nr:hypothetical protein [Candidatus Pacearchaeota archaeon]
MGKKKIKRITDAFDESIGFDEDSYLEDSNKKEASDDYVERSIVRFKRKEIRRRKRNPLKEEMADIINLSKEED